MTAAALLPVAALVVWKTFVAPRPFHAQFFDPEGIYFYGGIQLLAGVLDYPIHHPGGPVHLASALIAAATGPDAASVETFRCVAYVVAFALSSFACLGLARTVLAELPRPLAVVALWTWFLAPGALLATGVWGPEAFLLPAGACVLVALWKHAAAPESAMGAVWAGAALGLACSVKLSVVVWIPALVAALVVVQGGRVVASLRAVALAGAGAACAWLAGTMGAVHLYPRLWRWSGRIASSTVQEPEGSGFGAIVGEIGGNLSDLMVGSLRWHAWLAACAVVAIIGRRSVAADRRWRALLVFATASIALQYLIVPRGVHRWMLPNAVGAIVLCAAAGRVLAARAASWPVWTAVALAAVSLARQVQIDVVDHRFWTRHAERTAADVAAAARAVGLTDPVVLYGRRTPSRAFAHGAFARTDAQRARVLELRPREGWIGYDGKQWLAGGAGTWDLAVLTPREAADVPNAGPSIATTGEFVIVQPR